VKRRVLLERDEPRLDLASLDVQDEVQLVQLLIDDEGSRAIDKLSLQNAPHLP